MSDFKKIENYYANVEGSLGDVKSNEERLGLSFLRKFYTAVGNESMLNYFNKIIDGTVDESKLSKIITSDYEKLSDEEQFAVDDMALQFIHFSDKDNGITANTLNLHAAFGNIVSRFNEEDDKWTNITDGLNSLGKEDIASIIASLPEIGGYTDEMDDLEKDLRDFGPALTADVRSMSPKLYDLFLRLIATADAFSELLFIMKKLKYLSNRAGSGRGVLDSRTSRYTGEITSKKTGSRITSSARAREATMDELRKMTDKILDVYANILPDSGLRAFEDYILSRDVTTDNIIDVFDILSGKSDNLVNMTAYIQARMFNRLNILDNNTKLEDDLFDSAIEGLYYLAFCTDLNIEDPMEAVENFTEIKLNKPNIPKDYKFDTLIEHAVLNEDCVPVLRASERLDDATRDMIYRLFGPDRRGNFVCTIDNIRSYMESKMPNFKGMYKDTDITQFIVYSTGGSKWPDSLKKDISGILTDIMNNLR